MLLVGLLGCTVVPIFHKVLYSYFIHVYLSTRYSTNSMSIYVYFGSTYSSSLSFTIVYPRSSVHVLPRLGQLLGVLSKFLSLVPM